MTTSYSTRPARSSGFTGARLMLAAGFAVFVLATAYLLAQRWLANDDLTTLRSDTVLPVETVTAQRVDSIVERRSYTGRIEARRASALSFEQSTRLAAVLVDEGDRVRPGQALARLDTRRLEIQIAQLGAQKDQALARLDELRAGPRKETIAAARATLDEMRQQLELARIRTKRRAELLERQAISREELDQLDYQARGLQASYEASEARLKELETGTRGEQIRAQEAAVAELESRVAALRLDLEKAVLRAPFAGVVQERLLDEGVVVSPGAPVLRIVEQARPEARIGVPVEAAGRLREGDVQTVRVDDKAHAAKVAAVLPELEETTRTATVVLELEAVDLGAALAGRMASLELEREEAVSGYWLPLSALTPGTRGLWACYALLAADEAEPGVFRLERRPIEILHTEGERVLVRGALAGGDRVVRSGVNRVTAGQLVRPSAS